MITTGQYEAIHQFIADRIAEVGHAAMTDPFVAAVNAQLIVHAEVLPYRDHGSLDGRDAGFIDGLGLALLHVAARWKNHPTYQATWAPPRVEGRHLLDGNYT
ncbi:hypothetical protein [Streptomyces acidiscabies]|uniref:Toxin Doc n=1 Tax=Streptomyces acidiscabies TaxID=42234 RepID=A0ABU4MBC1_9ACTN|nr:hypothetical protein [Streptomyces acidiscabies]MDX3025415.1 hypothetical protein [Streptomyces acidiscabies]